MSTEQSRAQHQELKLNKLIQHHDTMAQQQFLATCQDAQAHKSAARIMSRMENHNISIFPKFQ
eukprot:4965990-Amphidinium_carterae.1